MASLKTKTSPMTEPPETLTLTLSLSFSHQPPTPNHPLLITLSPPLLLPHPLQHPRLPSPLFLLSFSGFQPPTGLNLLKHQLWPLYPQIIDLNGGLMALWTLMLFRIFTPFVTAQENRKRSFVSLFFPFSASSPLCRPPPHHPTVLLALKSSAPPPDTYASETGTLAFSRADDTLTSPSFRSSVSFPTISFIHHPPHSSTHPDFTKARQTSLSDLGSHSPPPLPPLNLACGTEEPAQAHSFSGHVPQV